MTFARGGLKNYRSIEVFQIQLVYALNVTIIGGNRVVTTYMIAYVPSFGRATESGTTL